MSEIDKNIITVREIQRFPFIQLLNFCSHFCSEGLLVVRKNAKLSEKGQTFLQVLKDYLIDISERSEWPGTILYKHTATVYRFKADAGAFKLLSSHSSKLDDWLSPQLPEDLSLFTKDKKPFLVSITHEGIFELNLTPMQYKEFKKKFPVAV